MAISIKNILFFILLNTSLVLFSVKIEKTSLIKSVNNSTEIEIENSTNIHWKIFHEFGDSLTLTALDQGTDSISFVVLPQSDTTFNDKNGKSKKISKLTILKDVIEGHFVILGFNGTYDVELFRIADGDIFKTLNILNANSMNTDDSNKKEDNKNKNFFDKISRFYYRNKKVVLSISAFASAVLSTKLYDKMKKNKEQNRAKVNKKIIYRLIDLPQNKV